VAVITSEPELCVGFRESGLSENGRKIHSLLDEISQVTVGSCDCCCYIGLLACVFSISSVAVFSEIGFLH
jgi:hypothetical protein